MRRIIFPLVKNGTAIVYPDDRSLFSKTEIVGAEIIANYTGNLALDEYVEPPAPESTRLTRLEFRNRFTQAEKQALYTAAESNIDIRIYLDDLAAAEYVDVSDPTTIASINSLAPAIIAPERVDEILAPVQ